MMNTLRLNSLPKKCKGIINIVTIFFIKKLCVLDIDGTKRVLQTTKKGIYTENRFSRLLQNSDKNL